jgi:hypothetical protein
LWVWGVRRGGLFVFQDVFGVESGLFSFHLDIRLWIQVFFLFFWDGIQSKEFPIGLGIETPKRSICRPFAYVKKWQGFSFNFLYAFNVSFKKFIKNLDVLSIQEESKMFQLICYG